ncbi:MAG: molecular chaperone TorD family protein [Actinobacteria bacterium]|nr:molecular chaperone TorD family protein [Actinomycetota bacterium]
MAINQNLPNMFKLFAVAFRPPSIGAWTDAIVSGALRDDMKASWEALELSQQPLDEFCAFLDYYVGRDVQDVLHEIRVEETRLFIGENPIVENSEGTWRQRKNGVKKPIRMINQHSIAVADFMRDCGIVRNEKYNDCIDYLENECDFCGFLATCPQYLIDMGLDPLDKLDEFINTHMMEWVPGFCNEVIAETKVPFYSGVCILMKAFIQEF